MRQASRAFCRFGRGVNKAYFELRSRSKRCRVAFAVAIGTLFTLLVQPSRAQPAGQYAFRTYPVPTEVVFEVLQDAEGFVWATSEDGLFRLSGQKIRRFGTADGLPIGAARLLQLDGSQRLWVSTRRGLARWDGQRFHGYGPTQGTPSQDALQLARGPDGAIWAVFEAWPLRYVADDRFEKVPGWEFGVCTGLASWPQARIWVAARREPSSQQLLLSFEGERWREWPLLGTPPSDAFASLVEEAGGRVWAAAGKELWVKESQAAGFVLDGTFTLPDARSRLGLDETGQLLITTDSGIYRRRDHELKALSQAQGLPAAIVHGARVDNEGSLWVAGLGLHRALGRGLWENHSKKSGLPGEEAWSVMRDQRGVLWVATNRGLTWGDAAGWHVVPGTEELRVKALALPKDGSILASTENFKLLRWNPLTQVLQEYPLPAELRTRVFHAELDAEGTLYLSTANKGLLKTKLGASAEFERIKLPNGSDDEMILGVSVGPSARVWASGTRGVAVLTDGVWQRYTTKDGLLDDVTALTQELVSGDVLTVYMTSPGMTRFRIENGKLRVIEHTGRELGDDFPRVFSIAESRRGWVFLGTSRGVVVQSPFGREAFSRQDGLVSDDISMMSFSEDANGDVWFGGSGGLMRFHTARYAGPLAAPRTRLLETTLGDQPVDLTLAARPLEVPRQDGALRAEFAAMSFAADGRIEYQTQLVGIDATWHATRSPEVRYPGLPPATYTFQVRSRTSDGPWGDAVKAEFRVLPAWYETTLARVLFGLTALGGLVLLQRWFTRLLRERNRRLEETVQTRTAELQRVNDAMSLVLTNTEQGLATIDTDGHLSGACSAAFERWFGRPEPQQHFAHKLTPEDEDKRAALRFAFEETMTGVLPLELALDQMPKELVVRGVPYGLAYKPISLGGADAASERVLAILLIVTDISAQLAARQHDARAQEQLRTFEHITEDRDGYVEFFSDACHLVDLISGNDFATGAERLRTIHTLTGNAALFEAKSVARVARDLEQAVLDGDLEAEERQRTELIKTWDDYSERVLPLFGPARENRIELESLELSGIIRMVQRREPYNDIEQQLYGLYGEPLKVRLWRIAEQVRTLSQRLGKGVPEIRLEAQAVRLSRSRYATFWSNFAHVVRNMVDHGFETEATRLELGKSERNQLTLSGRTEGGRLLIEIGDDGAGINWQRLAERAAAAGLPATTRDDLVDALFQPHISTADSVSETSGRGVGMTAVADAVQLLDGTVHVQSERRRGTTFCFDLAFQSPGVIEFEALAIGRSNAPERRRGSHAPALRPRRSA